MVCPIVHKKMIGIGGIQNHYNFHRILFQWHNQSPYPGANDQNPQHSPPKDLVAKFLNLSRNCNDYSAKYFSRMIVGWRTLSDIVKECHHWTHPYTNKKKAFWKPSFLHVQCYYCCLKLALLPQSRVEVIFFVKLGEVTMAMVLKNAQREKR